MRLLKSVFIFVIFLCSAIATAEQEELVNGKPIICSHEAYNCPSYKGKYQQKTLKDCHDVMLVWKKCGKDIHDLDRDGDGKPCEIDCP